MRRRAPFLTGLAALLAMAGTPSAGVGQSGSLDLLTLPVGARAASVAEALTAAHGGLESGPYNPAGLAGETARGLVVTRLDAPDLYRQHFLAMGTQLRSGDVLAATLRMVSLEPIPLFDESGRPAGEFSPRIIVFGVSGARTLGRVLDVGAAARWMSLDFSSGVAASEADKARATGPAVDVGAIVRPVPRLPVRFGASVLDLGPDLEFAAAAEPLPTRFRLGVAVEPLALLDPGTDRPLDLLLLADREEFIGASGGTGRFLLGAEALLFERVALRGGFSPAPADEQSGQRRVGLGILYPRARVEFAYGFSDNPALDGQTHITIGLRF